MMSCMRSLLDTSSVRFKSRHGDSWLIKCSLQFQRLSKVIVLFESHDKIRKITYQLITCDLLQLITCDLLVPVCARLHHPVITNDILMPGKSYSEMCEQNLDIRYNENPDMTNTIPIFFPGPVSVFSSSFIYQLVVTIGANSAICSTKL